MVTQDLMAIKTILSYQPQLHIFERKKDFRLPSLEVMHKYLF